jgi:uncharacterized protein YigE (DUF2233 family)
MALMDHAMSVLLLQVGVSGLGVQLGIQLWQLRKQHHSTTAWGIRLKCLWATLVLGCVLWLCFRQVQVQLDEGARVGWARVELVIYGQLELLPELVRKSALALVLWSLVLASAVLGAVATAQRKWLATGVLLWLATGPGYFAWSVFEHLQQLTALRDLMRSERLESMPDGQMALTRAVGVAAIGLLAAGSLCFVAARPSPNMGREPTPTTAVQVAWLRGGRWQTWFDALCALGSLAATLVLWQLGTWLQWEAEHPIDPTMAFANCSFCNPDGPGPLGKGPDALVEAPHVVFTREGPSVHGSLLTQPGDLTNVLKSKRELNLQPNPGESYARRVVFNVGKVADVAALHGPLAETLAAGFDEVYFLFSEVRQEQRPVLGNLWGRRDTALAVRVARSRDRCAELDAEPVPVALAAATSLPSWLGSLAKQRAKPGSKPSCLLLIPPNCSPDGRICQHPNAKGFSVTEQRWLTENIQALRAERNGEEYLVAFVTAYNAIQMRLLGEPPELESFIQLETELDRQGEQLVWAMNAGMYHPDRAPVGLYVRERKTLAPLNTKRGEGNFFLEPNGVFALTDQRFPRVLETADYGHLLREVGQPLLATQSGPLVLSAGKLARAFDPGSDSRVVRNGVGVYDAITTVFVISTKPVTFHEFAHAFLDFGCTDALYLDGNVSSLFAPKLGRRDSGLGLGPILYVTAPKRGAVDPLQP